MPPLPLAGKPPPSTHVPRRRISPDAAHITQHKKFLHSPIALQPVNHSPTDIEAGSSCIVQGHDVMTFDVPDNLWLEIFAYISPHDLHAVRLVNQRFARLVLLRAWRDSCQASMVARMAGRRQPDWPLALESCGTAFYTRASPLEAEKTPRQSFRPSPSAPPRPSAPARRCPQLGNRPFGVADKHDDLPSQVVISSRSHRALWAAIGCPSPQPPVIPRSPQMLPSHSLFPIRQNIDSNNTRPRRPAPTCDHGFEPTVAMSWLPLGTLTDSDDLVGLGFRLPL